MIIIGSLLLFIVISIIVLIFTRKITQPIETLTDLTVALKRATDMTDKERVVQDVKTHDIFKSIKSLPSSYEFYETQNHEE